MNQHISLNYSSWTVFESIMQRKFETPFVLIATMKRGVNFIDLLFLLKYLHETKKSITNKIKDYMFADCLEVIAYYETSTQCA